jgi:hypothetical protein
VILDDAAAWGFSIIYLFIYKVGKKCNNEQGELTTTLLCVISVGGEFMWVEN